MAAAFKEAASHICVLQTNGIHQNLDEMKLSPSSPPEESHKTVNLAVCFKRGNGVNNIASVSLVDDSTKLNFSRWKCWVEFSFNFEQPGEVQAP